MCENDNTWNLFHTDVTYCGTEPARSVVAYRPSHVSTTASLPVVFCTDGQVLPQFVSRLTAALHSGHIPPVMIVGVESSPVARGEEYLLGNDDARYQAHERLFVEQVRRWAMQQFNILPQSEAQGIFGFSNGATFALSIGLRHPELYGFVIAFSLARRPKPFDDILPAHSLAQRYYLAAGSQGREKMFSKHTGQIARKLQSRGYDCRFERRDGGHDFHWWQDEFIRALAWCIPRGLPSD